MSFCSPAAIKEIYGSPTKTTKSSFYAQVTNDPNPASLVSCRDVDIHERRKKAWVRALGSKGRQEMH